MSIAGVTLHQFLVNGMLAVLFIIALKWAAAKSGIRGLQDLTKNV